MDKLRLALSSNKIESTLAGYHRDGIGVYTHNLYQNFIRHIDIQLALYAYPRFFRFSSVSDYPQGHFWPLSFEVASLFSGLLPRGCLKINSDIFHATDYHIPKLSCPVVATLHDAVPLQYLQWASPRWRTIKNCVMRQTVKWADHIIALTQAVVPELIEYFSVAESRISVVHCGVDESWLSALSPSNLQSIWQKYGLQAGYFLFVGTLQPRKNIQRILQAFLALPREIRHEKKLVMVGRLGWNMEAVLPLLSAAQQQGEIIWLNNIQDESELRAIYQGAGVFVFPSLYEGFGIPVLEAFASRVPVLTSTVSALPEVAGGAALLVDPTDVEAITHGMFQLMTDSNLRQHCITHGYARAQEKTWAACAENTLAVYRKLL